MALTAIDTSDIQDAYLRDHANNTYGRHGVAHNAQFYSPVGLNGTDMFVDVYTASVAADIADSYAKDLSGGVRDRHGVAGMKKKHTTMNNGNTVNRII